MAIRCLRTPEQRFIGLADYSFAPHYTEVDGIRIHYVDEGPREVPPVLLLHGEPTWSYLYRQMIPVFVETGFRAVAPDLPGFGKSDKPACIADYSYQAHVDWLTAWLQQVDLRDVTLVCQDWGALIGLRIAAEQPERFVRIVVANGALPTGDEPTPTMFKVWRAFARYTPVFPAGRIVQAGTRRALSRETRKAYDAPFPGRAYQAGARAFPRLVPTHPDDPASEANRAAWQVFERWDKPFLTVPGSADPIFRPYAKVLQRRVPGAQSQPHTVLKGAGHFIQEDCGPELARIVIDFIKENPA